jgi:RTX calcium-binding nonapeptide repeat (4 copies)
MTSLHSTDSRPSWRYRLIAIGAIATLAATLIATAQSYGSGKVAGVRAAIKHGTLNVTGSDGGQQVALRLKAGDSSEIQVDAGNDGSADFRFASGLVEAINVKLGDGSDLARIDDANGAFTGGSRPTTIAGGGGNDTLLGAQNPPAGSALNQVETYRGGDGNDLVDGGRGNDSAQLGGGNDTFRWDPGEGNDAIEGQDGLDTMLFNGAGGTDSVTLSPDSGGNGLDFDRVQGPVHMDTNDVEVVDFNALDGADTALVNDLTGTDVTQTNVDLGGTDGALDSVDVNGTDAVDNISIQGNGSGADVTGLATADSVKNAETTDHLNVHTKDGADNVVQNVGGLIQLLVD